jgi:DNA-binding XRE family transcriptional regulator
MKKARPKKTAQQVMFYQQLGTNIRKHRVRNKLSQDELAKFVGLTRTSLTNIEKGRQHPPLHTFCEIVEQLKVDIWDLLPRPVASREPIDLKTLAGSQVRGENELAFIETAIGIRGGSAHGNTTKEDSDNGDRASR